MATQKPGPTREHGERMYRDGCRCEICRAWRVRANEICRERRARGLDRTKNPNHGTERRYLAGCRCRPCQTAYKRRSTRARRLNAARYANLTNEQRRARQDRHNQWVTEHRDHVRAYHAAWRAAHRETCREYGRTHRAKTRARHEPADMLKTINHAIAHVPPTIRDDVRNDLAIVWLTNGTITNTDVRAAVTANWRVIPVAAGREISLHTPISWDNDRTTLIDQLSA